MELRLVLAAMIGIIIAIASLSMYIPSVRAQLENPRTIFYIYGMESCPHCQALHALLEKAFGCKNVYFCSISKCSDCRARLLELYKIIGLQPVVPLTLVICDDCVKAIVVGEVDAVEFWRELVKSSHGSNFTIPVYAGRNLFEYLVFNNASSLKLFSESVAPEVMNSSYKCVVFKGKVIKVGLSNGIVGTELTNVLSILPTVILLALSDSINPCALYLYVMLLIAAALSAYTSSKEERIQVRGVLAVGISFILAVYIGYVALGFGLLKAVTILPLYTQIAALIAIAFGLWTIASGLKGRSRVLAKGFIMSYVPRAATSAVISFALGLLVTFTLLPCSAGPYVLFVTMVKNVGTELFVPLVLLYNIVFVSPMLVLLGAVTSLTKLERVQKFIVSNGDKLSILSGILLIAVGLYVLLA